MQDHVCASPHRSSRVTAVVASQGPCPLAGVGLGSRALCGTGASVEATPPGRQCAQMPTTASPPKRAQPVGYATGSAGLRRLSTLWHVARGSAGAVIATPDHLGHRGMNLAVRHRERHADAETKVGPHTASPRPPDVPPGLRQWNRGTGRDILAPRPWCGTFAAGPMCAPLCDGMPLERRGRPAASSSLGALYTLLDGGGQSPRGWAVRLVGATWRTKRAPRERHGRHLCLASS